MKHFTVSALGFLMLAGSAVGQEVHLDLNSNFNYDAFVENGSGSGTPLHATYGWLDATSLPDGFSPDRPVQEPESDVSFLFGNLLSGAADSFRIDNQVLPVPAGQYEQLHLAVVTPSSFGDLGKTLQLRYQDGSTQDVRFGPIANWFDSPIRYYDRHIEFTDSSGIQTFFDLSLQKDDQDYIWEIVGGSPNEPRSDYRFVDAGDSLTYEFNLEDNVEQATLGVDMLNNFVVEISTDFGETYTSVLNSQELYGKDVRDGSNRKIHTADLAPFLAASDSNDLLVKFTDGSTDNGWGPAIYKVSIYTGELKNYALDTLTDIDTTAATVYADFRTDGGTAEQPYLFENSNTTVSNNKHRFADGNAFMTYQFDLPNNVNQAKMSVNMEANFVVSVAKQSTLQTLVQFVSGGDRDVEYVYINNATGDNGSFRFVDGGGRLVYWFDLDDSVTSARLNVELSNNFVVSLSNDDGEYTQVLNSFDMYGADIHDGSTNRKTYEVDLTSYLANNPTKEVMVAFEDGSTGDGWGPAIHNLSIVSGQAPTFTKVFSEPDTSANSAFGYHGTSTQNKDFYEIDLSSFLVDNPEKTLYVKFSDGSTDNGWGPGLYRILLYSGTIVPDLREVIIPGIKTTAPQSTNAYPWGVNLHCAAYEADATKVLTSIALPDTADTQNVYLFAATLTGSEATSLGSWSLY